MAKRTGEIGSKSQLQSGRWRVRVQIDGKRVTVTPRGGVATEAVADEYLNNLQASMQIEHESNEITVGQYMALYLQRRKRTVRVYTLAKDTNRLRLVCDALGQDVPMPYIRVTDVVRVRDLWVDAELADQTIRNRLVIGRMMFRAAVEVGLIDSNPFEQVKLGTRSRRDELDELAPKVLRPDEQGRLIQLLQERYPHALPEVVFSMTTGVRLGEMCWLRWEDVGDTHVTIRRSINGEKPKNGRARKIALLPPAKAALAMAYGRGNEWCFVSKHGQRKRPPRCWPDAVREASGRYINWHGLRHTCATSLYGGWWGERWELRMVQQLLGHRSSRTTEIYADLIDDLTEEAVAVTTDIDHLMPTSRAHFMPTTHDHTNHLSTENHSEARTRFELAYNGFANRSKVVKKTAGYGTSVPTGGHDKPDAEADAVSAAIAEHTIDAQYRAGRSS